MATQVKILAALFVLVGLLGILGALFTSVLFGIIATIVGASSDGAPVGGALLGLTGMALSAMLVLFSLPAFAAGYGLWNLRNWGRILGIILGAIALMKFPLGTLFGVYVLIVLFRKDTEALFAR